jgi:hypothetical protein
MDTRSDWQKKAFQEAVKILEQGSLVECQVFDLV